MFNKFEQEVLKHYGKTLSDTAKYNLLKAVRKFNTKYSTHFWVQISRIGQSYSYTFLAVRDGGEKGTLIYVRSFRNYLKNAFEIQLQKLLNEFNASSSKTGEKNAVVQLSFDLKT